MAALIWNQSSRNRWIARITAGLFSDDPAYDGYREEIAVFQDAVRGQSWMSTIATVINVSAPTRKNDRVNVDSFSSRVPAAVHHRRRDRVVARLCDLATQLGRLLCGATAGDYDARCVSAALSMPRFRSSSSGYQP